MLVGMLCKKNWIVDDIALAYQTRLRAHYTQGVALFLGIGAWRLFGRPLQSCGLGDTFARFYNLLVKPVSSCVLGTKR